MIEISCAAFGVHVSRCVKNNQKKGKREREKGKIRQFKGSFATPMRNHPLNTITSFKLDLC